MSQVSNDHLVLIAGKSATGKSASLMGLSILNPNPKFPPEGVMYLNCENKKLPFKSGFMKGPDGKAGFKITDPYQIYEAFNHAETLKGCHTIVVDSLTYMMDMFETVHINGAANTMKAWGDYATFFKTLMSQYVAKSTKNVIFLAHTMDVLNEGEMVMETLVKVKGSLMNTGIESYFSTVVAAKKLPLKKLEGINNPMLDITEDDTARGFKYVFQTLLTGDTVNERIRAPLAMWKREETYIDNNVAYLNARLHDYYEDE